MNLSIRTVARHLLYAGVAVALLGCGTRATPSHPALPFPHAIERPVVDTYFGTAVTDPFRWLEEPKSQPTQRWMKDAAAHAEATLSRIPGREGLRARISELEAGTTAQIGRVLRLAGDLHVYERRGASDDQFAIVMRRTLAGAERVLVDPNMLSKAQGGVPVAVNFFSVSPDGRVLAYGVSAGGSEAATLPRRESQRRRLR